MLLSQANLKVHLAAAQRSRYALNTVVLSKRGSISTDGRLVLFIPYPTAKPDDVPTITGVNAASPAPWYPVLLRPEDAARAAGMVGKGKRGYAAPATDLIQAEVVGDKVVFGATDLSSPQVMTVNQVEGQWPDIGSVLPDHSKAMTITLNIDNTLRALKAIRAASKEDPVTLRIIDDQNGISYSTPDGIAVLQMPITVAKPEDHCEDKLAVLKETGGTPEQGTAAPIPAPTPTTVPTKEPDTSVGSPDDTADLPNDDDSDNDVDGDGYYHDDGPEVPESEMQDAAEVHAKAVAAVPEQVSSNAAVPTVAVTAPAPTPAPVPTPVAAAPVSAAVADIPVPAVILPVPILQEPVAVGV